MYDDFYICQAIIISLFVPCMHQKADVIRHVDVMMRNSSLDTNYIMLRCFEKIKLGGGLSLAYVEVNELHISFIYNSLSITLL